MEESLQACLYERVDAHPDRRILGFFDASHRCEWTTYSQLLEAADARARVLSGTGLSEGDVCVLCVYNDDFAASVLIGVLLAGGLPLLVAPPLVQGAHSSLEDILHSVIERTEAPVVVGVPPMRELGARLERRHPETRFLFGDDDFAGAAERDVEWSRPGASDLVAMQLTSGTTGFPRICVWKQYRMIAALDGMAEAMRVAGEDTYLNWTPLYHDMGLVNNFFLCLARGIPLVMMSPFEFVKQPALWLQALTETGANTTWSPNFGFALCAHRVRDDELHDVRLDHVRGFWNAAERIHHRTLVEFRERFEPVGVNPEALKTNFGCAENIGGATFSDPDGTFVVEHVDALTLHEEQRARRVDAGSEGAMPVVGCGTPHPGIEIHILDDTGASSPDGHVGEVALDTSSRMEGYLDNPEATAAAFHGGLLKTGDLGYLRGGELFWTGRAKERINVRGKKIDPSDLEAALLRVPGLREGCFAAFGVDSGDIGTQRLVVLSEVREPSERDLEEIVADVRREVQDRLFVRVDDVVLVSPGTLTKTSSGKRRHRHFRELYEDGALEAARLGR